MILDRDLGPHTLQVHALVGRVEETGKRGEIYMRRICTSAMVVLCAGTVSTASADVVMDNIGAMDGSNMTGGISASQLFEASFAQYSIAAIDDFSLGATTALNSVSFVIGGWNGYGGSGGILGYSVNVYSSIDAAGSNLAGDVLSMNFDSASGDLGWGGGGEYMTIDLGGVSLGAGDYLISVIANNEFMVNGQTGIYTSFTGGDNGYQANPGGGFGFGPYQATGSNYAYAIDGTIPAPGALALLAIGGLAVRRRR